MPKGLSFEQALEISIYTAVLTSLLTLFAHWIKNKFDFSVDNKKFKREFASLQLKELYLQLYAVVAQSEFVRAFYQLPENHQEHPFIEINKKSVKESRNLFSGLIISATEEEKKDAITEFNKIMIANLIIDKGQYASQKLLKKAVAYRYVHQHYLDKSISNVERFQDEEIRLIYEIVELVVKSTNEALKLCGFDYDADELKSGIMKNENILK